MWFAVEFTMDRFMEDLNGNMLSSMVLACSIEGGHNTVALDVGDERPIGWAELMCVCVNEREGDV